MLDDFLNFHEFSVFSIIEQKWYLFHRLFHSLDKNLWSCCHEPARFLPWGVQLWQHTAVALVEFTVYAVEEAWIMSTTISERIKVMMETVETWGTNSRWLGSQRSVLWGSGNGHKLWEQGGLGAEAQVSRPCRRYEPGCLRVGLSTKWANPFKASASNAWSIARAPQIQLLIPLKGELVTRH